MSTQRPPVCESYVINERPNFVRFRESALDLGERETWLVFGPIDGRLNRNLEKVVRLHASSRPNTDIFYGDQVVIGGNDGERRVFKPDFDRTRLWVDDYIGLPVIIRASAFHELGGLSPTLGAAALYDLILRAVLAGHEIERIDDVLVTVPEDVPTAAPLQRCALVRRALQASGVGLDVHLDAGRGSLILSRRFTEAPPVTLIVSRERGRGDRGPDHRQALEMRLRKVDWPADRLEVVFSDRSGSSSVEAVRDLNTLWRSARDFVVFLDEDLVATGSGWLAGLMTFAVDAGLGAVSGRVEGLEHDAEQRLLSFADTRRPLPRIQHEVSGASRAVMACRTSVLEEVNGFDERLAGPYSDMDLCLRMRLLAYRIVHAPNAAFDRLGALEPEQPAVDPEQTALFLERWYELLKMEAERRGEQSSSPQPDQSMWWRQPQ